MILKVHDCCYAYLFFAKTELRNLIRSQGHLHGHDPGLDQESRIPGFVTVQTDHFTFTARMDQEGNHNQDWAGFEAESDSRLRDGWAAARVPDTWPSRGQKTAQAGLCLPRSCVLRGRARKASKRECQDGLGGEMLVADWQRVPATV